MLSLFVCVLTVSRWSIGELDSPSNLFISLSEVANSRVGQICMSAMQIIHKSDV